MTEREIELKIGDCEKEIKSSYASLIIEARNVGAKGYQAAQKARLDAMTEASSNKTTKLIMPLLAIVAGIFVIYTSWLLGIVIVIGGSMVAYNMGTAAEVEKTKIERDYANVVNVAVDKNESLKAVIENNKSI